VAESTILSRVYALGMDLALPFLRRRVGQRLAEGGVAPARIAERDGRASLPRPEGRVVWVHGVSVGESVSALPLIEALLVQRPGWHVVLTSGTASSAHVIAARLPAGTVHQFAPLDAGAAVGRFLDHWRPDLAVFIESELWPRTLALLAGRGVPVALVNARLSQRSGRRWRRVRRTAREIVGRFALIHCQDAATAALLRDLGPEGGAVPEVGPNLKAAVRVEPPDAGALAALRAAIGGREVWVAASTHPGEEAGVLAAQAALVAGRPGLLLILVPRHPERRAEIAGLIAQTGLRHAARGEARALPGPGDQVYLADTLGEMALWYNLGGVVFLGGSWVPVGGHNPFEPAAAGAAVLHGPLCANFEGVFAALDDAGGGGTVADGPDLARAVEKLMADGDGAARMRGAAQGFAAAQAGSLAQLAGRLAALVAP
jgi:3-deoxy-D-manno-octulosonic-acid transferase